MDFLSLPEGIGYDQKQINNNNNMDNDIRFASQAIVDSIQCIDHVDFDDNNNQQFDNNIMRNIYLKQFDKKHFALPNARNTFIKLGNKISEKLFENNKNNDEHKQECFPEVEIDYINTVPSGNCFVNIENIKKKCVSPLLIGRMPSLCKQVCLPVKYRSIGRVNVIIFFVRGGIVLVDPGSMNGFNIQNNYNDNIKDNVSTNPIFLGYGNYKIYIGKGIEERCIDIYVKPSKEMLKFINNDVNEHVVKVLANEVEGYLK